MEKNKIEMISLGAGIGFLLADIITNSNSLEGAAFFSSGELIASGIYINSRMSDGKTFENLEERLKEFKQNLGQINEARKTFQSLKKLSKQTSKDIDDILNLYQGFIKDYNDLNKTLNLNNPVELYALFTYLLYNGYLSKDKSFTKGQNSELIMTELLGSDILSGYGFSKQITAILHDIFKDYGIQSGVLPVYYGASNCEFRVMADYSFPHTKQELYLWLNENISDYDNIMYLRSIIDEYPEEEIPICFSKQLNLTEVNGKPNINHAINMAVQDGKSYFLDSSFFEMYRISPKHHLQLYSADHDRIFIMSPSKFFGNSEEECALMERSLSLPSISRDEEVECAIRTLQTCEESEDLFESFYQTHQGLYDEVSSKSSKVKTLYLQNKYLL